jgi:hypothetical protein
MTYMRRYDELCWDICQMVVWCSVVWFRVVENTALR